VHRQDYSNLLPNIWVAVWKSLRLKSKVSFHHGTDKAHFVTIVQPFMVGEGTSNALDASTFRFFPKLNTVEHHVESAVGLLGESQTTLFNTALQNFFQFVQQTLSSPFLYSAPQALTSLISSASAGSGPVLNVADLRGDKPLKLQDSLDDDDFFKDSIDAVQNGEEMKDEMPPSLLQRKINKIVQKIRFVMMLTNTPSPSDDEFQKEQDEFDKEFEQDFGKQDLVEGSGYFYDKPVQKSAKQEASAGRGTFNPSDIGVFFMELVGTLVGLAYGAAAQLNYNGGTTTTTP
jgi:hypothetical protein